MRPTDRLVVEFGEFIPEEIAEGKLYVSIEHATVVHRCACGCGTEVVTPLSPTDWALTYDGESASLDPSIGNWDFPCRSHYWVRKGRIAWTTSWSRERIEAARTADHEAKRQYYDEAIAPLNTPLPAEAEVRPRFWVSTLKRLRTLWPR